MLSALMGYRLVQFARLINSSTLKPKNVTPEKWKNNSAKCNMLHFVKQSFSLFCFVSPPGMRPCFDRAHDLPHSRATGLTNSSECYDLFKHSLNGTCCIPIVPFVDYYFLPKLAGWAPLAGRMHPFPRLFITQRLKNVGAKGAN